MGIAWALLGDKETDVPLARAFLFGEPEAAFDELLLPLLVAEGRRFREVDLDVLVTLSKLSSSSSSFASTSEMVSSSSSSSGEDEPESESRVVYD